MKRFFLSLVVCLPIMAIAQEFRLCGKLNSSEFDGLTVSLVRIDPADRERNEVVDTASVSDGRFSFTLPAIKPYLVSVVFPPKDRYHSYGLPDAECVVENGDVTIDYPFDNPFSYRLVGGVINADFDKTILAVKGEALRQAYHDFIARNITNDVGATMFLQRSADFFPKELYGRLRTEVNQSLLHVSDSVKAERQRLIAKDDSIRNATHTGATYSDFTSLTVDGKEVRLSSLLSRGRVLLLDFWASWCGPCRQEIPVIKELYRKYHQHGLDVVSVSLDTKREAWEKALKTEDMPWLQLSTLEGFKSESARNYAVRAIPFIVLIGGDGKLLLVNIHGKQLEDKIVEALGV